MRPLLFFLFGLVAFAQPQPGYWQQHVDYTMEVDVDVKTFRYSGTQELVYTNKSPDTLNRVFYHLYFNAFQPGSEMDVRSRNISDPDSRVGSRIEKLTPEEVGFLHAKTLAQDGEPLRFKEEETILVVPLAKPLAPGASTTLSMVFEGQVPKQIRRSGRDSKEGVALSMTQWYPKLAEYDHEGWHANPYIGREFHGVWGNFDVKLTLDKKYIVGGTGYLQNPEEVGHGYAEKTKKTKGKKLTWHFVAPNVHDFAWAADPDYIHDILETESGVTLHFLYKNNPDILENWKKLQPDTAKLLAFFNRAIGAYPYKQYTILQGGDGGMEYAMCTLITGERSYESLYGVTSHELAHSWFQHVLAFNESKYAWMDEGFTTFIDAVGEQNLKGVDAFAPSYSSYRALVNSGLEEPLTTHADRFATNRAYGTGSYSKGAIFLSQLAYIIGYDALLSSLQLFYYHFAFTHPTPNDFKRIAEKVSGIQLEWYLNDWTRTTKTIDYAIKSVTAKGEQTEVVLERIGEMGMPIDLGVLYKDGSRTMYNIPLQMMFGEKPPLDGFSDWRVENDWAWARPTYTLIVDAPLTEIELLVIDPLELLADINLDDNVFENEK
ncbi:MAG: M1 family metallopeptidase [Flavobacteriaceae bacterium]